MKYDPSELGTLAKRLESAARVARAKSSQHKVLNEAEEARREQIRAEDAEHFAAVCSHFQSMLTTKTKRAGFEPPSLADVLAFAKEDSICKGWPLDDIGAWYDHFKSNGWRISGKAPMIDWRSAARNGARRYRKEHPSRGGQDSLFEQRRADPAGWREFCKANQLPYSEYLYAPDWMKSEFRAAKR